MVVWRTGWGKALAGWLPMRRPARTRCREEAARRMLRMRINSIMLRPQLAGLFDSPCAAEGSCRGGRPTILLDWKCSEARQIAPKGTM